MPEPQLTLLHGLQVNFDLGLGTPACSFRNFVEVHGLAPGVDDLKHTKHGHDSAEVYSLGLGIALPVLGFVGNKKGLTRTG